MEALPGYVMKMLREHFNILAWPLVACCVQMESRDTVRNAVNISAQLVRVKQVLCSPVLILSS